MTATPARAPEAAFRDLRRALARRRLRGAGLRACVVVVAIAAIVSAFVYWQVRVPLDGLRHRRGEGAAALALGGVLAALALAGAASAASRMAAMRGRRPGPEWLALPAPPARMVGHLAEEARLLALAALPPGGAVILAGAGLLPAAWLAALAAAFVIAWRLAAVTATTLARDLGRPGGPSVRGLPPDTTWLSAEPGRRASGRLPSPVWRRGEPPAQALARLDALASRRRTPSRARLSACGVFVALGLLVWFDGAEPLLRRAQAFAFFLPAAALLGAWAIRRACAEPPDLHRPLPLSLHAAWRARAVPVLAIAILLAVANALAAVGLPPAARLGVVAAWTIAGFAVSVLGLHFGLTLVPRADAAETVYVSWLGATLTASVMIPLLGWVVLAAGLVLSSVRLRRWWAPEWVR